MTGRLAENVAHFARALRKAGLAVGPGAVLDAVEAVAGGELGREDLFWTLHAIFVKRHEDSALFAQGFALFWRRRALVEKLIAQMSPIAPGAPAPAEKPEAVALRLAQAFAPERPERPDEPERELTELSARLTVSERETLRGRDFAQMTAAELARARRLVASLVMPEDRVATRRFSPARRPGRVDMRRSFRRSLSGAGMIDLAWRDRKEIHPPIVALVDISGSMAEYSRIFLHFLHALTERRGRVHSFVFGTRLTNVTRSLRQRDADEALALAGRAAPDWEGGTRIAEALGAFNRQWSRRVLSGGAVVLLFTDGLERHLDDSLAFETDRLRRSCRQLVWLNPLLRYDAFEARASGIRAMLPHVDAFRPIHNLAAMADLCAALSPRAEREGDPRLWLKRAG